MSFQPPRSQFFISPHSLDTCENSSGFNNTFCHFSSVLCILRIFFSISFTSMTKKYATYGIFSVPTSIQGVGALILPMAVNFITAWLVLIPITDMLSWRVLPLCYYSSDRIRRRSCTLRHSSCFWCLVVSQDCNTFLDISQQTRIGNVFIFFFCKIQHSVESSFFYLG